MAPAVFLLGWAAALASEGRDARWTAWQERSGENARDDAAVEALLERAEAGGEIGGVELWVSSSSDRWASSLWGHVALRFVLGGDPLCDPVVSLVAAVDRPSVDPVRGLTGGYRTRVLDEVAGTVVERAIVQEGREITRYPLRTTPGQRRRLVEVVERWRRFEELPGKYTFFHHNCADALLRLLGEAGLALPGDVGRWDERFPRQVALGLAAAGRTDGTSSTIGFDLPALARRAEAATGEPSRALFAGDWGPHTVAGLATLSAEDRVLALTLVPSASRWGELLATLTSSEYPGFSTIVGLGQ